MNVHIISQDWRSDQILSRLARALVDGTGWTISQEPDASADLNYFLPYLFWDDFRKFRTTPIAGWYTHRDHHHSDNKAGIWDRSLKEMNIRTTSTKQNLPMLLEGGPSFYVTPPLDRNHFTPATLRSRRMEFHIGVAGMVYKGGRKGEGLVKQLSIDPQFQHIEIRAAGRGWPVKSQYYPWETLPTFYQDLDVFLCTSLNEGPGYPPLEALSCGVPIVIPRGVGMFDELPEVPGIWRYEAGDYVDMTRALTEALNYRVASPEALRAITERYTANNWVNDHFRAFETLVNQPLAIENNLPAWEGNSGIFYVAYGEPARNCCKDAIGSVRRHLPGVPIAVSADSTIGGEDYLIPEPDRDIGGRWAKTLIYDITPQSWNYVLYLDADTEIISPDVKFLFEALQDGWEFVICKNPERYASTRFMHRPDNQDEIEYTFEQTQCNELIQWNGGVFGFRRNERVKAFFKAWHEEWQVYGKRDQAALIRAMWKVPLRVLTLGNEWNTVTRYIDPAKSAGILHYPTTARRYSGVVQGRLDSPEAWGKVPPQERRK